ncbi:Uncharacterised protein [Salmonella enterica subsp. arizonae]|uniref:Uncharacterized protein n=1 Tax=Salmonella enterica subsp. arizonae TaxID=59203 RepID=A0A447R5R0_SALER|nr:Uncharacterised protein [Salmonella enterica subsp. arizonae]
MKIRKIFAISLAASSFSCLAFKAPPNVTSTTPDKVNALESKILGSFYSQHGTLPQVTILGTCDASPFLVAHAHSAQCSVAIYDNELCA